MIKVQEVKAEKDLERARKTELVAGQFSLLQKVCL